MEKKFENRYLSSKYSNKTISFLVLSLFFIQIISADDNNTTMSDKSWFKLYQERVTEFCSEYKENDNTSETIYLLDDSNSYIELKEDEIKVWDDLTLAKNTYRKNMDSIYNCATYLVTYRAINFVKDKLANESPALNVRLAPELDKQLNEIKLKLASEKDKCKVEWKEDNIIKKSVLKQTTYEMCRYRFYLEYLKEHNDKVVNLDEVVREIYNSETLNETPEEERSVQISKILSEATAKINEIDTEIDSVTKTYSIVFKAFSEYENNLIVHILLELLKKDFELLKEKLHLNLNPINQVVYKISNAMKK